MPQSSLLKLCDVGNASDNADMDRLPSDPRKRPSLGNGNIGIVVGASSLHINGVYNGRHSNSHRAVIPSALDVTVIGTEPAAALNRRYALDASSG